MSWRLVFGLSCFGLVMALATVFARMEPRVEQLAWIGIFLASAIVIAKKASGKFFLHGFLVSVVDSLWVTGAHLALFDRAGHAGLFATPIPIGAIGSAQTTMALVGPVAGIVCGVGLGFLAWAASTLLVSSHSEFAGW
jgi:hypothetical protein